MLNICTTSPQGGTGGYMNTRITPFGSHGVPLWGFWGPKQQFHRSVTQSECVRGIVEYWTDYQWKRAIR